MTRACLYNKQSPDYYHFITMIRNMYSWKKGHLFQCCLHLMSMNFKVIIFNILLEKKNGNYEYGDFFPSCLVSVSEDAKPLITSLTTECQGFASLI